MVSESEEDPIVSRAFIDSKEVNGETVPGLDPFVAYEHASRREERGEDLEYEVTENGGIRIFYGPDYLDDDPTQESWSFSIKIEVMDDQDNDFDSKYSYVEVRYNPKIEDHNDGDMIWENIVDTLEDRTVRYHREIKGGLHD